MTEEQRLVSISCSDKRMDILDTNRLLDTPVNRYKITCDKCRFPDIDNTPDPYYLAKNRIFTGIEIIQADLGNLLVSDRVKRIFELLLPDSCRYQRIFIQNSNITTNWWLAVPTNLLLCGEVDETVKRCSECNQPLSAHPGTQYKYWVEDLVSTCDIVKATNWASASDKDWKTTWIGRHVYLSIRLITLSKKISAKGIYKPMGSKFKGVTKTENNWVEESLVKIGSLKNDNSRKELTTDDIAKLKVTLGIKEVRYDRIKDFERLYKRKPSELFQLLCSVEKIMEFDLGNNEKFVIDEMDNWESVQGNKKLIRFAQDRFGNSLQFDITNKLCPIYHYDHETMTYDQIHKSILDLIE